jgi:hypothetical protein
MSAAYKEWILAGDPAGDNGQRRDEVLELWIEWKNLIRGIPHSQCSKRR